MDVHELILPNPITVADSTSSDAVRFGANRKLSTISDYDIPQAWSEAFARDGHEGIAYASRFASTSG